MFNKKLISTDLIIKDARWNDLLLIKQNTIENLFNYTLSYLQIRSVDTKIECSVALTDDDDIKTYNSKFRDKNSATNTLSFPSNELTPNSINNLQSETGHLHLGDMLFALETIKKEAEEQSKNLYDHFYHLLLHSFLHLLGYKHYNEKDQSQMENIEINILNKLGIKNPYE